MRGMSWVPLVALAAALGWVACRSSSEAPEILPFPIQLRATSPGDSVTVTDLPLIFSATFNQEIQVEDVFHWMIPPARDEGTPSAHGRTFDLTGVLPASTSLAHWMILDGPRFLRPYVVRFFTGDARGDFYFSDPDSAPCLVTGDVGQVGSLIGTLFSTRLDAPSFQYALVYAYRRDQLGPDPGLDELLSAEARAVAVSGLSEFEPSENAFALHNLVIDVEYTLLVIVDSNGDGRYETSRDWWGYAHDAATGELSFASAHIDHCTPTLNVEMRPPTGSGPGP